MKQKFSMRLSSSISIWMKEMLLTKNRNKTFHPKLILCTPIMEFCLGKSLRNLNNNKKKTWTYRVIDHKKKKKKTWIFTISYYKFSNFELLHNNSLWVFIYNMNDLSIKICGVWSFWQSGLLDCLKEIATLFIKEKNKKKKTKT